MIRPAILAVLAIAVAAPVAAESIYIEEEHEWTASSVSEYELVEDTERILLARAVAIHGDEVRFKIEEALKGETAPWLQTSSEAAKGDLYIFFMNGSGDQWNLASLGSIKVDAENRDWVRVLRLFAKISALDDDESEKEALRELREAALAAPGRYPKSLVRMIDLHFGTPSPDKPFSDLTDLFDAAPTDGERLAVLWALRSGDHPEVGVFFGSLLLGGEPLWLMEPVLEWMSSDSGDEVPLLKDLARVWLRHPGEDRTKLLDLMLAIAEPEDVPLLWSLLPTADLAEKETLVNRVLGGREPNPFADKLRLLPDDPVTADLFLFWTSQNADSEAQVRLEALLRKSAARDWRPVVSLEELLSTWEAARKPAERREILMEIVRRVDDENMAALWRLLRQASPREAEALLHVVYLELWDEEELAALYRAASGEEEKNRALWFLLAALGDDELEPLLSSAGALGQGSVRLERVARAFLTCPSEQVRLDLAHQLEEELAVPGDFLTMLKVLEGANLSEARKLAPWFARHPGPEALPLLWRLPIPSLHLEPELSEALAASGDPEVLDLALDMRQRVATEDYRWPFRVIARSPLPAALEEARALLQDGGYAWHQLMRELGYEAKENPWREQFLQEVAASETVDDADRENAITYLARLSSEASPEP